MGDVVAQLINRREVKRKKFQQLKQLWKLEKTRRFDSRRQALFQEYHDGGEQDAMVYLTQLDQKIKWQEHSVETSEGYRVILECDGEVRKM